MSSVRRPRGRLFQIRGPAAPKLLSRSPKLLCIRGTAHMLSEEDRRDRRLPSETRWISSARYVGTMHNAWRTRQASLNSTRCRTGSQCIWQHRRNVVTTSGYGDEACCILQRLDSPHDVLGHSIQKRIAVVQTARYERLNHQCLGSFRSVWPDEWT